MYEEGLIYFLIILINLSFCFWFESLDIFFVFKLFPPVTKEIKFNLNGMLFLILASVA